jgi:hypothetical protein
LACPLNLSKGTREVKVIDFLLPIKIGLPRIYLRSDKLFFASSLSGGAARNEETRREALEVDET